MIYLVPGIYSYHSYRQLLVADSGLKSEDCRFRTVAVSFPKAWQNPVLQRTERIMKRAQKFRILINWLETGNAKRKECRDRRDDGIPRF